MGLLARRNADLLSWLEKADAAWLWALSRMGDSVTESGKSAHVIVQRLAPATPAS